MTRPRLILDLAVVRHNVERWRARLAGREVWAVVKSDGYGLGALPVTRACVDGGAARIVIFDLNEAAQLRAGEIRAPIIQIFATPRDELAEAARLGVVPTLEDEAGVRALAAVADWRGKRIAAHVAVDTGTGWSGVQASRAGEFAAFAREARGVVWEGAWTHIASKDAMDDQMRSFATAVAAMRAGGLSIPTLHVASTGPASWGKTTGAARIGVGLYGAALDGDAADSGLRTAVEVRAPVVAVKQFDTTTRLGYGGEDAAQPGDFIATLRIGYADGLPKPLADGGGVALIGGQRCPIAGAIGMNCTMVRVPIGARVEVGDEAVLLGDAEGVRIDDVARASATIPHAILTGLAAAIGVAYEGAGT